jgi:hypothetical protein
MTSLPNIDPAELDRLLKRKRKRWGARRKQSIPSTYLQDDQPPSVVTSDNDDNDVLSDGEIDIDPRLPPSAETSSNHVYRWVVVMEHQRGYAHEQLVLQTHPIQIHSLQHPSLLECVFAANRPRSVPGLRHHTPDALGHI